MNLSDFDYELPQELVAHSPAEPRDSSRLMVVNKQTGEIIHDRFFNVTKYLDPSDLVVFNDTKVIPARLFGKKETGGKVEILLLKEHENSEWEYISKPGLRDETKLFFDQGLPGIVQNGRLVFDLNKDSMKVYLDTYGYIPLPPYIHSSEDLRGPKIKQSYQTVYAKEEGSAAAPTAGLHFTPEVMAKIKNKAYVTLHVGLGTFMPVKVSEIENHTMHSEQYSISENTKHELLNAKQNNRKIIAVGTTSVRTLETWAQTNKIFGETDIFIYPGYKFKIIDGIITNFHLPKSTLLMLVSAFAGKDLIKKAYTEAIKEKYRFFSFGDAMLLM